MPDPDFNEEVVYALWSVYVTHTKSLAPMGYVTWAEVNGY